MHHTINASEFLSPESRILWLQYEKWAHRQTCIGLIFGGKFEQLKEALVVMSVDYTLRWLSIALIVTYQNRFKRPISHWKKVLTNWIHQTGKPVLAFQKLNIRILELSHHLVKIISMKNYLMSLKPSPEPAPAPKQWLEKKTTFWCTLYSDLPYIPRTYHLMLRVKHLLSKVSNQSAPSEDVALWLDTLATCIPLLTSSEMYVAMGMC
jgi:hypothetical protein